MSANYLIGLLVVLVGSCRLCTAAHEVVKKNVPPRPGYYGPNPFVMDPEIFGDDPPSGWMEQVAAANLKDAFGHRKLDSLTDHPRVEDPEYVCSLPADSGPCRAYLPRYYFNKGTKKCQEFVYGSCGGNANRFETKEECNTFCRSVPVPL